MVDRKDKEILQTNSPVECHSITDLSNELFASQRSIFQNDCEAVELAADDGVAQPPLSAPAGGLTLRRFCFSLPPCSPFPQIQSDAAVLTSGKLIARR
ncbi:hypothetical protein [Mesorhizobium amorphae]|uniref:hypothetical protein n=1 Tax=Mesorhizobium amorphae TaxID=71433 RepID=UPI00177AC4F7|nr:hypothetical protein [Mesorhizobium amorphae]